MLPAQVALLMVAFPIPIAIVLIGLLVMSGVVSIQYLFPSDRL